MDTYIFDIKNELYNYVISLRDEMIKDKNNIFLKSKYDLVLKIYNDVYALNNVEDIKKYLDFIISQSLAYEKEYSQLRSKYISEKNSVLKSELHDELFECASKLNAYNETNNIIVKLFNSKSSHTTTQFYSTQNGGISINNDIELSNKIISLLEKYNSLDKNTTEAKKVLEEIYILRVNRENRIKEFCSGNYSALISQLESIEYASAVTPSEGIKPKIISLEEYIFELRNTINAINEYFFVKELQIRKYYKKNPKLSDGNNENKFNRKYNYYLRNFKVLIRSLFKKDNFSFKVGNEKISINDFLCSLEICNLDGDYSVYKSKFEKCKIGNVECSKKQYNDQLAFLNKCINSLCELVEKKFENNTIKVVDNQKVKRDYLNMRNDKLKEIYLSSQIGKYISVGNAYAKS